MKMLKTRTVFGAVVAVIGYLLQPDVLAILPEKVAAVLVALGTLLSVFGLRGAVAKAAAGK